MPGESYRSRLRSLLLYLCYVFPAVLVLRISLCVDSARALWASFCFRFVVYELFVTLPLTINENMKMAVIAAHRNAGVSLAVTEKCKV